MIATDPSTSAPTARELIAAPLPTEQILVKRCFYSSPEAEPVGFLSGAVIVWQQFPGTNGGHAVEDSEVLFACAPGTALTYTTAAASSWTSLRYDIAPAVITVA